MMTTFSLVSKKYKPFAFLILSCSALSLVPLEAFAGDINITTGRTDITSKQTAGKVKVITGDGLKAGYLIIANGGSINADSLQSGFVGQKGWDEVVVKNNSSISVSKADLYSGTAMYVSGGSKLNVSDNLTIDDTTGPNGASLTVKTGSSAVVKTTKIKNGGYLNVSGSGDYQTESLDVVGKGLSDSLVIVDGGSKLRVNDEITLSDNGQMLISNGSILEASGKIKAEEVAERQSLQLGNASTLGVVAPLTIDSDFSINTGTQITPSDNAVGKSNPLHDKPIVDSGNAIAINVANASSQPTLTVDGALTIGSSGGGQNGKTIIDVQGAKLGKTYDLIHASKGISGKDMLDVEGNPFIKFKNNGPSGGFAQDLDNDDLRVTAERNQKVSFADANYVSGQTFNEVAVARAVDSLGNAEVASDLANSYYVAGAAGFKQAENKLSGQVHSSIRSGLIENSYYIRNAVLNRLDDTLDAGGHRPSTAEKHLESFDKVTAWGQIYGAMGHISGANHNSNHMSNNSGGFVEGVDVNIGRTGRAGAYIGYGHSMFGQGALSSSAHSNDVSLGLYGGKSWGHLVLKAGVGYTFNLMHTSRTVALPGAAVQYLSSNSEGGTAQAFTELGYKIFSKSKHFMFEPFVRGAYVNMQSGSYHEHGGYDALHGNEHDRGVTYGVWGARINHDFTLFNTVFTARGLLGYRRAFGNTTPKIHQRFLVGGDEFTIAGSHVSHDTALMNLGFDSQVTKHLSLGINYMGQYGTHQTSSGGNIRMKWAF